MCNVSGVITSEIRFQFATTFTNITDEKESFITQTELLSKFQVSKVLLC